MGLASRMSRSSPRAVSPREEQAQKEGGRIAQIDPELGRTPFGQPGGVSAEGGSSPYGADAPGLIQIKNKTSHHLHGVGALRLGGPPFLRVREPPGRGSSGLPEFGPPSTRSPCLSGTCHSQKTWGDLAVCGREGNAHLWGVWVSGGLHRCERVRVSGRGRTCPLPMAQ